MKKVLLCDANFCVLPILKSIMSKNYSLSVVGSLIDDPAHQIAHNSFLIDYSQVEILYKHIQKEKYNFIVPGCNDRSYLSLSEIHHLLLGTSGFYLRSQTQLSLSK